MGEHRTGETGLPVSFELAWGVRARPTKGPKRGMSLEQVVKAGVTVAASEGLGAVSMNRVAKELGTTAMALYRYVGSKDELLELMVDTALGEMNVDLPIARDDGWRAGLERWAWIEHAAYLNNLWVLQVPITGPPLGPNSITFLEHGLRCLADTPLSPGDKMSVMLTLTSYTRAWAILSSQVYVESATTEAMGEYGNVLQLLTTREEFPALHEILEAGVFAEEDEPDYDFRFGLERLLDGFEVLITSRAV
jgi:AcrR family transcriptional regulator